MMENVKVRNILVAATLSLLGGCLIYSGIISQGVILALVGATLVFESFVFLLTPQPSEKNYTIDDASYLAVMEDLLAQLRPSFSIYNYLRENGNVKVYILLSPPVFKQNFMTCLKPLGLDLLGRIEKDLGERLYRGSLTDMISMIEDWSRKHGIVRRLELRKKKRSFIVYMERNNLGGKDLYADLPWIYTRIGCPITSAIATAITKYIKKPLSFHIEEEDLNTILRLKIYDGYLPKIQGSLLEENLEYK